MAHRRGASKLEEATVIDSAVLFATRALTVANARSRKDLVYNNCQPPTHSPISFLMLTNHDNKTNLQLSASQLKHILPTTLANMYRTCFLTYCVVTDPTYNFLLDDYVWVETIKRGTMQLMEMLLLKLGLTLNQLGIGTPSLQ